MINCSRDILKDNVWRCCIDTTLYKISRGLKHISKYFNFLRCDQKLCYSQIPTACHWILRRVFEPGFSFDHVLLHCHLTCQGEVTLVPEVTLPVVPFRQKRCSCAYKTHKKTHHSFIHSKDMKIYERHGLCKHILSLFIYRWWPAGPRGVNVSWLSMTSLSSWRPW